MQILVALLSFVLLGAAVSTRSCANEDGLATTIVIDPAACGCPGPTATVYESTSTKTSAADCCGCSDIVASTFADSLFCPALPCVGIFESATESITISGPPKTVTKFTCSPTLSAARPRRTSSK